MRRLLIIITLVFAHKAWSDDNKAKISFHLDQAEGLIAYHREDYATALDKLRSPAQQGSATAQYYVATIYHYGRGVAQNYNEAMRLYRLAAKQGFALSQYGLGSMYHNGQGVPQDYKEAVRWYQLAAKQGNADAQNNLGRMYGLGQGVLQDYVRAHVWYNIAAVNGDKNSVKNRDLAASKMTPQQIEQAQRMARECMASNFKNCD